MDRVDALVLGLIALPYLSAQMTVYAAEVNVAERAVAALGASCRRR
jgi:hypothetical protein